ncbi:MAG: hypothetical protein EBZ67_04805 [Chitinophagia bacterium]|nr:hypothetical protein [Chitinophagia bacterium]
MGNRPPLLTLKNLRPGIPIPYQLRSAYLPYIIILLVISLLSACSGKAELALAGTIGDYMPLQTGRSLTYRLDSTLYPAQGTATLVRSHVVCDRVVGEDRDLQGRPLWRIVRAFRNPVDTTKWTDREQFLAILAGNTLEWVEDNLRTIRLVNPVREGYTWEGNRFVNTITDPARQYLDGWKFTYLEAGKAWRLGDRSFPETLTVRQQEDRVGNPADRSRFSSIDVAREVYAKGIGLVYREVRHEVWQPPNASSATGYFEPGSFALTLSLVSNN